MDKNVIGLLGMLHFMKDPIKDFKKDTYEEKFHKFEEIHKEILNSLKQTIGESDNKEQAMCDSAEAFAAEIDKELESLIKKRKIEQKLADYNMTLVTYVFPAILDKDKENGVSFVEKLIDAWKKHFPKTDLKPATFEKINAGFKQRYCYITTAVCESLGKPDECYELTLLRDYRDHYLAGQENGAELIQRYYDIAPTIVKRINRKPEREEIFKDIWTTYLKPCIELIEAGDNEGCMVCYTNMVYDLQEKYFDIRRSDHE